MLMSPAPTPAVAALKSTGTLMVVPGRPPLAAAVRKSRLGTQRSSSNSTFNLNRLKRRFAPRARRPDLFSPGLIPINCARMCHQLVAVTTLPRSDDDQSLLEDLEPSILSDFIANYHCFAVKRNQSSLLARSRIVLHFRL